MMLKRFGKWLSFGAMFCSITGFGYIYYRFGEGIHLPEFALGISGAGIGLIAAFLSIKVFERSYLSTVFIAHTFNDSDTALKMSAQLTKKRIKVIDEDAIVDFGEDFSLKINQALKDADYIIVLVSNSSKKDKVLKRLIAQSSSLSKRIIPVVIDEVNELPQILSKYKYVDVTEDFEKTTDKLADRLLAS